MQEKTHSKIALKIADEFLLNEHETSLLEIGSITPDRWMDFPHRQNKEFNIMSHLFSAKELYLKNDDECFHSLGLAFHYLQDMWTLRQRSESSRVKWEQTIENASFLDDDQFEDFLRVFKMPIKSVNTYLAFFDDFKNEVIPRTLFLRNKMKRWGARDDEDLVSLFSRFTNEVKKFSSLGEYVLSYALIGHPTTWSGPAIDLKKTA